jgi:hypothetical protein
MVVGIMAILAQAERKMPQGRGQKLGGFRGYIPTAEGGTNGRKARRGKALNHAASLVRRTLRGSIRTARCRSEHLRRKLTAEGLPTSAGTAAWIAAASRSSGRGWPRRATNSARPGAPRWLISPLRAKSRRCGQARRYIKSTCSSPGEGFGFSKLENSQRSWWRTSSDV